MTNDKRFDTLRGYYDKSGYHCQGGNGISLEQLLDLLDFKTLEDFWVWYDTVPNVKQIRESWPCLGKDCQSLLDHLLKIRSSKKHENV